MKTRLIAVAAATAAVLIPATAASAGGNAATMFATPNPVTLGDNVDITNTANPSSTCEGNSQVWIELYDPTNTLFDEYATTPDGSGTWVTGFTPDATGAWTVQATCETQDDAFPNPLFEYQPLTILVQAPGTTVTVPTTSTTAAPTTTAAAAATVTPAFTG